MKAKPKQKRSGWLTTAAMVYASALGGIGGATYVDAMRPVPAVQQPSQTVFLPPEAFDRQPMAPPTPLALPPCPQDAIAKPVAQPVPELRGTLREPGTVMAYELNIRREPNPSGKIVGSLYRGDQVDVLERKSDGWLRIKQGWVYGRYVDTARAEAQPAPEQPLCPLLPAFCPPGSKSVFNQ